MKDYKYFEDAIPVCNNKIVSLVYICQILIDHCART